MFRNTNVTHHLPRRPLRRTAGLWMATALLLFAPVLLAIVSVQSVSLSPTTVNSGGTSTGTVTLDPKSGIPVSVFLFSSNPNLARLPDGKISVTSRTRTGTFPISTAAGGGGCATISARIGTTTTRSALLFVQPPSTPVGAPVSLTVSPSSVEGGASATGSLVVIGVRGPVQLSSNNPSVTVPASVMPEQRELALFATFSISTQSVAHPGTCAIITATFQGSQSRALLKVTPFIPQG